MFHSRGFGDVEGGDGRIQEHSVGGTVGQRLTQQQHQLCSVGGYGTTIRVYTTMRMMGQRSRPPRTLTKPTGTRGKKERRVNDVFRAPVCQNGIISHRKQLIVKKT
jgi:hypothetical protein